MVINPVFLIFPVSSLATDCPRWPLCHFFTLKLCYTTYAINRGEIRKKLYRVLRYGRLVSFKIIEICTNQKIICDFLLVFRCNNMPIFYRFRDMTVCWSKIGVLSSFLPTPVSFEALTRDVPLGPMV